MIMFGCLVNMKIFVLSWHPTFDELAKLIGFSQCLCQDLNLKHTKHEFMQYPQWNIIEMQSKVLTFLK